MANPFDRLRETVDRFWTETYPAYSREERIEYWIKQLRPGVEWERKQGGDPYQLFAEEAMESRRQQDAAFDTYLPDICSALDLDDRQINPH